MSTKITVLPGGPLMLEGTMPTLHDGAGAVIDTTGKDKLFLCRCGASAAKPFCDGSHKKIGFEQK